MPFMNESDMFLLRSYLAVHRRFNSGVKASGADRRTHNWVVRLLPVSSKDFDRLSRSLAGRSRLLAPFRNLNPQTSSPLIPVK